MGLKHLKPATDVVPTPGGDIAVRGLNFVDITAIVEKHRGPLTDLFGALQAKGGALDLEDSTGLLAAMITQAPHAAAMVISLAADEEDESIALGLVFPVQLEVLEKVATLTFASEGGLKKVVATVVRVLQGTTSAMQALKA